MLKYVYKAQECRILHSATQYLLSPCILFYLYSKSAQYLETMLLLCKKSHLMCGEVPALLQDQATKPSPI
jgi:hypothetical protein